MLKNKLNTLGITILLAIIGLVACQDDPEFPDPGFEISDKNVVVRRDTINTYHVSFEMNVPNGTNKIQILNGIDYSLIEEKADYNGLTKFIFEYDIDLTPFEKDTTLNYIFRAVDNYERSINKGLQLTVKKKSSPEITVVGGDTVALSLPAYLAKALVITGLAPIETISIRYEGYDLETITMPSDTLVYEYKIKEQLILGMIEEGREYALEIEVNDRGFNYTTASGEKISRDPMSYTKKITVTRGGDKQQIPSLITYLNGANGTPSRILIYANGDTQVDSMTLQLWSPFNRDWRDPYPAMVFKYNAQNMVDTIRFERYGNKRVLTYIEGTTMLDKIEEWADINATPANVLSDDIILEASNFTYNEFNQITSYFSVPSSYMVNDLRYTDPFDNGQYVGIEHFFNGPAIAGEAADRPYFDTYAPVFSPLYMSSLPSCVELEGGTIFEEAIKILGSNPYQPLELKDSNGEITKEYTYTTDEQGRITLITWEAERWGEMYTSSYTLSYN